MPLKSSMAAKLLLMATTLLSSMASTTMDFVLDEQDGIWEIACAPHSWLSEACDQQGLRPRRINLQQGYDIYKTATWEHLKGLRRRHRPRRLWFSLPCTKWCQWSKLNYSTEERQELLATYRRRERRMLWQAAHFIEDTLNEDPETDIYWEWPWPCEGWNQRPLEYIAHLLQAHGREWLPCRVDGCNYGLRADDGAGDFLRKRWMIRTTSSFFHQRFKAKVCPGSHRHAWIQGAETSKSSYYPWRMVKSMALAWRQEYVSDRNMQLIFAKEDKPYMVPIEDEINMERTALQALPALQEQPAGQELLPEGGATPSSTSLTPTSDELKKWKARLVHFHKAAGHPTARNLARLVREAGGPLWKIQAALEHTCETCKAAIADIKHVATAIHQENLSNSPEMTLTLAASALNGTEYTAGYSSHQWAFGTKYSISDEDIRIWNAIEPKEDFLRITKARSEAEEIARRSRARRVLSKLANTTVRQPVRQYAPTELVMELPDLPAAPDETTLAPIRRAVGKSTLKDSDYKVVHRSSPIGQARAPPAPKKYLPPPRTTPTSEDFKVPDEEYTPSLPDPEPGDDPEPEGTTSLPSSSTREPEVKRHRGDHETEYDLKWLDLLREEAQDEITHHDLFAFLESYDGECLSIEVDIELKNRRQRRSFMQDPVLYLTKKLNSSEVTTAGTLEHAREIQAMIAECRAQATSLEFVKFDDISHWSEVVFIGMGDQAHNNRSKGESTGGFVILASSPACKAGHVCRMSLLAWRTWRLKRRAVGSNDAEVQAILETEDVLFRCRLLWAEIHGAGLKIQSLRGFDMVDAMEEIVRRVHGVLCTDSRGGFDAVEVNESPLLGLANLRSALQAFQLRDHLKRTGCELRWVASDYDLGDALTKKRLDSRLGLQRFLQSWKWAINFDPTGPFLKPDLSGLRKESHRHRLPFDRRGFFEPFVFATAALPLQNVNLMV
ncbi:unnamed protein product [Durusdinium trenchii]|uniref:Uncharacterized protein n=1 Tax=Durusdinium trenchii TaxID=1381693 RepID=A0ABP0SPP3_9DINO